MDPSPVIVVIAVISILPSLLGSRQCRCTPYLSPGSPGQARPARSAEPSAALHVCSALHRNRIGASAGQASGRSAELSAALHMGSAFRLIRSIVQQASTVTQAIAR